MTFDVRENLDFLLGGGFLATAPFVPHVCSVMTNGQINDTLTLIIQVLSVILILIRIGKATSDESKDETHS